MYKRFPKLNCPGGVKIVARLRINYGAKQSFFNLAEKLGFWDYISCSMDQRNRNKKSLLEDTFEAFVGVTESLLDEYYFETCGYGVGYSVISRWLTKIFDECYISLKYEDLYDSKTRLKEIFDHYGYETLGVIDYEEKRECLDGSGQTIVISKVFQIRNGGGKNRKQGGIRTLLGEGTGTLKSNAQQNAAKNALKHLRKLNFYREDIEKYYENFY